MGSYFQRVVKRTTIRQAWRRIAYFFPVQLLVLHFKKNHLLLLVWFLLFAYVTGNLGVKYGIPYLFLYPEYFGSNGFWSFAITGFSFGGFMTAFNLYTYTTHAHRFPFLATIARPFLKFSINNALIPLAFLLTYLWCSAEVQHTKELVPAGDIALHLAAFVIGVSLFLLMAYLYFTRTNTDIEKMTGKRAEEYQPETHADILGPMPTPPPLKGAARKEASRWLKPGNAARRWHVETYMTQPWKVALARSSAHYDRELLRQVLWQNHINGSIFEVLLVASFLVLGAFSDTAFFAIPAGASGFVLFTMLLMILTALFSWLKGWTLSLVFGAALLVNTISRHADFFYDSSAYGLDYSTKVNYNVDALCDLAYDKAQVSKDLNAMRERMDRWQRRNIQLKNAAEKPKLVIVCASGGGLRSTLWSFRCLQHADSLLGGTLMQRTALLAGSSGGSIGVTFFRQLYHDAMDTDTVRTNDPRWLDAISSDVLNPVAFNFVTNDLFIRYRRVSDGVHNYTRDRGSAFEQRLNEITNGHLDLRLRDMARAEADASVPVLVLAPTIINDGRRLLISSSRLSFLTDNTADSGTVAHPLPETVELQHMFAAQNASDLKLTSALRMNSTFPYIMPMVTLPSDPPMRVMDAGIRENFGYRTTFEFLRDMREWIDTNTSGVVILQLRDKQKRSAAEPAEDDLFDRLLGPAGNVYRNVIAVQDNDYDMAVANASSWAPFPIDIVDLEIEKPETEEISMSWHLTAVEKRHVLRAIRNPANQQAFQRFKDLIEGSAPLATTAVEDHSGAMR